MNTDNPKGNIMTTTQDPYAPESATDALMVKDTRTPAERRLAALLDARGANEQATEPEAVLRAIALELIEREQADRHELQAQGKHPSPCARFCEATAFGIKIRDLEAQLRAALAAPQPATGKWATIPVDPTPAMLAAFKSAYKDGNFWLERIHGAVHAMLAAAPQPAQEPAANEQAALIVRGCCEAERANPDDPETICINVDDLTAIVGLYTTPQAPQPLTPEEIDKIYRDLPSPVQHWQLARAIEAAHGITKGPAA